MRSNQNKRPTNTLSIVLFSITFLLSGNVFSAFTIVQTGPGGGIIFQVTRDKLHGLEAVRTDQSAGLQWHNEVDMNTMAVKSGIKDGNFNTDRIITIQGNGNYAALLCANYNGGGYGDWYLPSKDELSAMYTNLRLKGLGGFVNNAYWSSTEIDDGSAWMHDFGGDGSLHNNPKWAPLSVRCVRAF